MDIFQNFLNLLAALEREKVEYVLIGGYAVILHGFFRATQDIDLFVKPDEENMKLLRKALKHLYEDESIMEITAGELVKYPVIRYGTEDGFYIDIIGRIGTAFSYEDLRYEVKDVSGQSVRLATAETLYMLKKDTMREIDQMDLRFLERKLRGAE